MQFECRFAINVRKLLQFVRAKKCLNITQLILGFKELISLILLVLLLHIVFLHTDIQIQKNTHILRAQLDKFSVSEYTHISSTQIKKENFAIPQSLQVLLAVLFPEKGAI